MTYHQKYDGNGREEISFWHTLMLLLVDYQLGVEHNAVDEAQIPTCYLFFQALCSLSWPTWMIYIYIIRTYQIIKE